MDKYLRRSRVMSENLRKSQKSHICKHIIYEGMFLVVIVILFNQQKAQLTNTGVENAKNSILAPLLIESSFAVSVARKFSMKQALVTSFDAQNVEWSTAYLKYIIITHIK